MYHVCSWEQSRSPGSMCMYVFSSVYVGANVCDVHNIKHYCHTPNLLNTTQSHPFNYHFFVCMNIHTFHTYSTYTVHTYICTYVCTCVYLCHVVTVNVFVERLMARTPHAYSTLLHTATTTQSVEICPTMFFPFKTCQRSPVVDKPEWTLWSDLNTYL